MYVNPTNILLRKHFFLLRELGVVVLEIYDSLLATFAVLADIVLYFIIVYR